MLQAFNTPLGLASSSSSSSSDAGWIFYTSLNLCYRYNLEVSFRKIYVIAEKFVSKPKAKAQPSASASALTSAHTNPYLYLIANQTKRWQGVSKGIIHLTKYVDKHSFIVAPH